MEKFPNNRNPISKGIERLGRCGLLLKFKIFHFFFLQFSAMQKGKFVEQSSYVSSCVINLVKFTLRNESSTMRVTPQSNFTAAGNVTQFHNLVPQGKP